MKRRRKARATFLVSSSALTRPCAILRRPSGKIGPPPPRRRPRTKPSAPALTALQPGSRHRGEISVAGEGSPRPLLSAIGHGYRCCTPLAPSGLRSEERNSFAIGFAARRRLDEPGFNRRRPAEALPPRRSRGKSARRGRSRSPPCRAGRDERPDGEAVRGGSEPGLPSASEREGLCSSPGAGPRCHGDGGAPAAGGRTGRPFRCSARARRSHGPPLRPALLRRGPAERRGASGPWSGGGVRGR